MLIIIAQVAEVTSGETVERGVEGEVYIRGPQVMKGYLNNEEASRKTLKDGWLCTGNDQLSMCMTACRIVHASHFSISLSVICEVKKTRLRRI